MLVSRIFDRAVSLIIRAKIAADTDSMVRATTAAASLAAKTTKVTETKTETRSETKTQSVSGSENEPSPQTKQRARIIPKAPQIT